MKEKKQEKQRKRVIKEGVGSKAWFAGILLALMPIGVWAAFCYLSDIAMYDALGSAIHLLLMAVIFLFVLMTAYYNNGFYYDNREHPWRFVCVFLLGILLTVVNIFLPDKLWLFLPLGVMLVLFSGLQTGICSYILLLYLQILLTGAQPVVFFAYVCIGMIGITMFSVLDSEFLFGLPLFSGLILSFVTLLSMEYIRNGHLHFDAFLYAAINMFISFLLITFSLKYVSYFILHKNRDKYQEINDPEYALLTELKKTSQKAYYHAIHTAYFCEKIARKIGADEMLAKAGGYYHKIGKMRGTNNLKNSLEIAKEYHFPPQLVQLLKEYGSKNTVLSSKEAAIVVLADAMVSSVMFLFEKDKNAVLDYAQIVSVVFSKQLESGILDSCNLTMEQLKQIRTMFTEETLYYDFLR